MESFGPPLANVHTYAKAIVKQDDEVQSIRTQTSSSFDKKLVGESSPAIIDLTEDVPAIIDLTEDESSSESSEDIEMQINESDHTPQKNSLETFVTSPLL
jgi:hypothetical protein